MQTKIKVAIVGGGVSGSTVALHLGSLGVDVTLFEKESSLSSGPPYCHLHAGGNLYREISDEQCINLLRQSIAFVRAYPFTIDHRPTVIALPRTDNSTPEALVPRLQKLKKEYQHLINVDRNNQVLGTPEAYFKLYDKKTVERLQHRPIKQNPKSLDDWLVPALKYLDLDKIQFPLVMVQEYGINLFRYAAGVSMTLDYFNNVNVCTHTLVENIQRDTSKWIVHYRQGEQKLQNSFDYLINATGFRTGTIDDMLGLKTERMVEFKASYVTKWEEHELTLFPEIIIHGERGTPQGMAQFTPYPAGYFQLHGMTQDITLYEDGLVSSTSESSQPALRNHFIEKLDQKWHQHEINERTFNAIQHVSQFIPHFIEATVGSKPLFGAQQIPGDDPTLRVAEVSFPIRGYARCEIVKVSSSLNMVDEIISDLVKLGYLEHSQSIMRRDDYLNLLNTSQIEVYAEQLAEERCYPKSLARINVPKSEELTSRHSVPLFDRQVNGSKQMTQGQ